MRVDYTISTDNTTLDREFEGTSEECIEVFTSDIEYFREDVIILRVSDAEGSISEMPVSVKNISYIGESSFTHKLIVRLLGESRLIYCEYDRELLDWWTALTIGKYRV